MRKVLHFVPENVHNCTFNSIVYIKLSVRVPRTGFRHHWGTSALELLDPYKKTLLTHPIGKFLDSSLRIISWLRLWPLLIRNGTVFK